MPQYQAPLKEHLFLIKDVFPVSALSETALFEDATLDIYEAVLEEAAKFAEAVLAPINRSGDEEGCSLVDGRVTTPDGFREAYDLFRAGGWAGLTAEIEHGGQGLPHSLHVLVDEIMTAANPGFGMYRGLIDGAYRTILKYGSETLKADYLHRLASGDMLPTMNLTEPHCGSDLGLLRTRAEPEDDGSYRITGTKIFITGGEHDLTPNILHLVLARLPDAPAGSRGISLFLVPKFYTAEDGTEIRNAVSCGGIEHKMGLKASATCLLNYDGAKGWLVGPPHGGLAAMFTMMNSARLGVGVQAVAAMDAVLQISSAYTAERRQGKAPGVPGTGPDPIALHPDVRRMLMTQKAFTEGGRALALRMALAIDRSHAAQDAIEREQQDDLAQLLTPIVKAFLSDAANETTNLGLQSMGGHGYIREWGVEQWVRDIRIAAIYEGTNGIQGLDLVGRKLVMKGGRLPRAYFDMLRNTFERATTILPAFADAMEALETLETIIDDLMVADEMLRADVATEFLTLLGLVAVAGEWASMTSAAAQHHEADAEFYQDKLDTADFYIRRILPRHRGLAASLRGVLGPAASHGEKLLRVRRT